MPATIREVLIPETEYQEYQLLKSGNTELLQTLLEHHLYNQADIHYHNSPTAQRSHALLIKADFLDVDGNLTAIAKVLPLYINS
jgi:hypothetical protein